MVDDNCRCDLYTNLPLTVRKLVWQDRLETLWINLSEKIIIKKITLHL